MRSKHRSRRRKARRYSRKGGSALVGKPYSYSTWGTSNYYAYNQNPKLNHPEYNLHKQAGGGKWYDMFDPRARPVQSLWSVKDSAEHGLQSGVNAFFGKYPTASPNNLLGHFQR